MKYKYLIIDEDGSPHGTNSEECASAYKTVDCFLVINLETMCIELDKSELQVPEKTFDPEDWV